MTETNANRKVVLIAEDSAINRALLRKIFANEYAVEAAQDGFEALEKLRALPRVDLIILDIMMPRMNGFETLESLRREAKYSGVPVIVATAENDEASQIRAFDLGAEDVFTKPYNPRVLLARANNVIAKADSTALKSRLARQEELLHLAQRDALTGLLSRDAFCETATRMIAGKPDGFYVIVCFDVDNFKIVNDQYGPEVGSSLLANIARTIDRFIARTGDGIAARISADNFTALLPAATPLLIQEMVAAQRDFFARKGVRLSIYMSAGRYLVSDHTLSVTAMLDRAIMAKRTVKGRYGNNTAYFNEKMRQELLREQTLISQMEGALKNGEFEPWLQLQFNHSTKAVTGAEALVRWRRTDSPPIFPGEFISLFERNGFIYEVDKSIWRQTCALLRKWIDEGDDPLPISVNISRCDVFHEDFYEVITGLLTEFKLPVRLLRLEITESAFAEAADSLIDMVKRLRAFGFVVEIDDFGSGYSSLNTLKDVPADVLKLDMRFLSDSEDARRGGSIVESIVRMAKWLDMTVIAEGVETQEEADFLRSIGCVYIQGYLYARPVPVADCEQIMRGREKEAELRAITTVKGLSANSFWDPHSIDTLLFASYVGAACILEFSNERCEIVRVNDRFMETLRTPHTAEQVLKTNPFSAVRQEDIKAFMVGVEDSAKTGREFQGEMCVCFDPDKTGPREFLRYIGRVIAGTQGGRFVYLLIENISDQKLAEARERAVSARLKSVMENVSCGICAYALDGDKGVIAFANDRYYELLGYTKEQFEREVTDTLDYVHPLDRDEVMRLTASIFQTGAPFTHEYRCIRRGGQVIWVRCSASAYSIAGFDAPVLLTEMSDITKEKLSEQKERELFGQMLFLNETSKNLLAPGKPDDAIRHYLQKLLGYFDAVSVYVYEYGDAALQNTYELRAPGAATPAEDEKSFAAMRIKARLPATESRHIRLDRARAEAAHDSEALSILNARKVDGLIAIPLMRDGRRIGFIGVDGAKNETARASHTDTLGDYMAVMLRRRDYERALSDDNDMLNRLVQDMPGGYMRMKLPPEGAPVPLYFNDGLCRLLGLPRDAVERLFGGNAFAGIHEDDISLFSELIHSAARTDKPVGSRIRLKTGSNAYRWLLVYCGTSGVSDEKFLNVYFVDAEDQLETERLQRELLDHLPCGAAIYEMTDKMRTVYVNQSFRELVGKGADPAYKSSPLSTVHPEDRAPVEKEIAQAVRTGRDIDIVFRMLHSEGEYRPYHVIGRLAAHGEGAFVIYATYTRVDEEIRSLRLMLTEAVENIPAGIAIFEQRGDEIYPIYVSDNVCGAFGYTREMYDAHIARGEPVFSSVLAQELRVYHAHRDREITHERILTVTRRDGTPFDLRVRIRKRLIGEKIIIYCTLTDVTKHMENERQKRIQDERYRLLVELRRPIISDYDVERDTMTVIVHRDDGTVSESVLSGYLARLGNAGTMLPDSREEYSRCFRQALEKPVHGSFSYHADYGEGARWYRAFYSTLADQTGAVCRGLFMSEDITAEYQEHQKLLERAEFDPVTKLMNRASAEEFLTARLASDQRGDIDAIFMIDIDDFKLVNDSLGHQAGDQALQKFAETLRHTFRAGDLICRFGGDEFVVFMPSCGSQKVALDKARGLIDKLTREEAGDAASLKCSIGLTMVKADDTDLRVLLAQADRALYLSKRRGKNTCTMFDETMEGTKGNE